MGNNNRTWAIAIVLIGLFAAFFLVFFARPQPTCGNGDCDAGETMVTCALDCESKCGDGFCNPDGESPAACPVDCKATVCGDGNCEIGETPESCVKDCPVALPPAPAPAPAATPGLTPPPPGPAAKSPLACGDGACDPGETNASCPADCPLDVRCGDGSCGGGETALTCPADCQPPGGCRDEAFRKIVASIVKKCALGCKYESTNPVVGVDEGQFRALFARAGDAGLGVHFAVFGCNVWRNDGKDCWGYDAAYASPAFCPADANYECATRSDGPLCNSTGAQTKCKQYASAIEAGVRAFVDRWREADHILLLGTASRTGNQPASGGVVEMAVKNRELALLRAANVEGLIDQLRGEYEQAKKPILAKTYKVVLDNTKQFFDSSGFKKLVGAQMKAGGPDGGFKPTTDNAINRSVMMIAVKCDLRGEAVD